MRHLIAIILLITGLCCARAEERAPDLNGAIERLDYLISKIGKSTTRIQERLDSMSGSCRNLYGADRCRALIRLADAYRFFNADSSLVYANQAVAVSKRIPSEELQIKATLARVSSLSMLGIFTYARDELRQINPDSIPASVRTDYYYTGRMMYSYIVGYLDNYSEFAEHARVMYRAYDDSLINLLPRNSQLRSFLIGERYVQEQQYGTAIEHVTNLFKTLHSTERLYAMAAFQLAMAYRAEGKTDWTLYYLALAAQGDLENGVRDGLALPILATMLYQSGKLDQAYRYINVALEDAAAGGIRWRAFAVASMVPSIDSAYRARISASHRMLVLFLSLAVAALVVAGLLLFQILRERKKTRAIARRLHETATLQNSYIGNFVAMCASYADRLNFFTSTVDRKLAAGQVEELKKMLHSGKFMEGQDEDFYRIFDHAFLDLYPEFVDEINQLLREEGRLSWKKGQPLSPELRIYALVKLGVVESTRIAQILHYSVSTVYAYRNRMRNRAVVRETFEEDVLEIGRHGQLE